MESNEAKIYTFPILKKKIKSEASKKRTRRINSFITDLLFIQIFQKMAIFAYIEFVNQSLFALPFAAKANLMGNLSQMRTTTMFLSYFSYFLVSAYLFEGKTIGKSLFNLRIVSKDREGRELSFKESVLRAVGYTISYIMLFLPFLASAFTKNGRGLPDFLSQTEVMTDEQYELFLIDQNNVGSETAQESDFSQAPEGPVEQLDLFAA